MDFSQYGGASPELTALLATLPPLPNYSVAEFKKVINQGREDAAAAKMRELSSQVTVKDHSIRARDGHTLDARSYRSASTASNENLPIYIHYHGGGFMFGTLSSEDATCSLIALHANVVVLNVNYRHTPEWKYPTAWHDSEDAYEWVYANASDFNGDASRIVVGGISAGAQLAASLAQTKKKEQAPSFGSLKGQVLMIPCVSHPKCYGPLLEQMAGPDISSYKENEFAPLLPVERVTMFTEMLFDVTPDLADRKANPGHASAEEVQGLPPATFGIAGLDPLRDEGLLYAKLLAEHGVATDIHVFKGVPHGYRRFAELSLSKDWDEVMHRGITWALEGPKATGKMDVIVHQ